MFDFENKIKLNVLSTIYVRSSFKKLFLIKKLNENLKLNYRFEMIVSGPTKVFWGDILQPVAWCFQNQNESVNYILVKVGSALGIMSHQAQQSAALMYEHPWLG